MRGRCTEAHAPAPDPALVWDRCVGRDKERGDFCSKSLKFVGAPVGTKLRTSMKLKLLVHLKKASRRCCCVWDGWNGFETGLRVLAENRRKPRFSCRPHFGHAELIRRRTKPAVHLSPNGRAERGPTLSYSGAQGRAVDLKKHRSAARSNLTEN